MRSLGGWGVWLLMLLLAWTLPGRVWRPASLPAVPLAAMVQFLVLLAGLVMLTASLALLGGPRLARSRVVSVLETPPAMLWGILVIAAWPASWGPPGVPGWLLAFFCCAVPSELRWLAQALPTERPFPAAWGEAVRIHSRRRTLTTLLPRWIAIRLPVWILSTLILERMLGLQGLGSDWVARITARDRLGVAVWVVALAALWAVSRRWERDHP